MATCKLILPVLAAVESCDAVHTHRSAAEARARPILRLVTLCSMW